MICQKFIRTCFHTCTQRNESHLVIFVKKTSIRLSSTYCTWKWSASVLNPKLVLLLSDCLGLNRHVLFCPKKRTAIVHQLALLLNSASNADNCQSDSKTTCASWWVWPVWLIINSNCSFDLVIPYVLFPINVCELSVKESSSFSHSQVTQFLVPILVNFYECNFQKTESGRQNTRLWSENILLRLYYFLQRYI